MWSNNFNLLWLQFLLCTLHLNEGTLTPKSPKSIKESRKLDVLKGPVEKNVVEKLLVTENPSSRDILANHQAYYKDTSRWNFTGMVLGYVTPWNNHGYDVAKLFGNKFTHISPVWLQVRRNGEQKYEVTGTHDVDKGWMQDVRKGGRERGVKIVPRILFDGWTEQDFKKLLQDQNEIEALTGKLVSACRKHKFDGLVVEVWSQVVGRAQPELLINLIQSIAKSLSKDNLETILVIPPKRDEYADAFTPEHYDELYDYVTAFSLMTYDYSNLQRPGANAPIKWFEECVTYLSPEKNKRGKILAGLNFYGNAYTPNGGKAIVGEEYIVLLKNFHERIKYDPDSAENYFEVKNGGRYFVFYPTLHSIRQRLVLAETLGAGLSIWELGQGLDYFYDLF